MTLVSRGAVKGKDAGVAGSGDNCGAALFRFFAEAAVLVLVFGVLDFFMQHGHIEGGWVAGALWISVALLATSVVTEFSAGRCLGAHP